MKIKIKCLISGLLIALVSTVSFGQDWTVTVANCTQPTGPCPKPNFKATSYSVTTDSQMNAQPSSATLNATDNQKVTFTGTWGGRMIITSLDPNAPGSCSIDLTQNYPGNAVHATATQNMASNCGMATETHLPATVYVYPAIPTKPGS